jgi:hypothetical protein
VVVWSRCGFAVLSVLDTCAPRRGVIASPGELRGEASESSGALDPSPLGFQSLGVLDYEQAGVLVVGPVAAEQKGHGGLLRCSVGGRRREA